MKTLTAAEFQRLYGHGNQARPLVPNSKPVQQAPALAGTDEGQALGSGRPLVRFTLCRVRLLDTDAKYASIKDLLDGVAKAGLIRGDREEEIRLEVEQVKVPHFSEERTEISIIYP